jgi:hypothetical protein
MTQVRIEALAIGVNDVDAVVLDVEGVEVPSQQMMPNWQDRDESDAARYRLHFPAKLPALGCVLHSNSV